ncbi:hypothetical protein KVT40_006206 [Elsinoe batatas]|uniref:glutamine--tRNA ligase n=1 Tax=Elsinoe batatas TaxID=2601811 RepID=A0A8K0KYV0_9PEZI|nr:hypothetical protein KVT40_006206 [Elsinoe batatas]
MTDMDESLPMFREGFLAEVYRERLAGKDGSSSVITRFPPEPNGFLHLGHSKAIAINFGFAKFHGGECILRFDDTNPAAEEERYFTAIRDIISWLGFTPARITYSSDNFDRLYELAEDLILRDGAYVCHCDATEIKKQRGYIVEQDKFGGPRYACPHRDRPVDESVAELRAMRDGKYTASQAVMRMKQDLESNNPQMWDLAAYRVLDTAPPHFRTGSKWKIYPTYDFTHCLCDSFESITHSLCTTEFELSRISYEWLCDKLEVYKPMQREYGRLNITGTVMSKRKIADLIKNGHVSDWDDPRLYTLIALRRRGIPPGAILAFVNELGVTKASATIETHRFEQTARRYLELTVPRLMMILDPVLVVIEGLPQDHLEMIEVPFGKDPAFGTHKVPFTNKVYIDRSDFREVASKDFFRLAPGKPVGLLKVPFPITATSFDKDESTGAIKTVYAKYDKPEDGATIKKPKSYIQWVAECPGCRSPHKAPTKVFRPLLLPAAAGSDPKNPLLNPQSLQTYPNAIIETGFEDIWRSAPWPKAAGEPEETSSAVQPECVRFQAMRVGYFCVDSGSTLDEPVFNQIVSLKEDRGKS